MSPIYPRRVFEPVATVIPRAVPRATTVPRYAMFSRSSVSTVCG
jgi:hypothetical protein